MGYKGHYGEYTGNAKHSRTPITKRDVHSAIRDDKAHMDYLKRDVLHDAHHVRS